MTKESKPIALGMTAEQWVALMSTNEAQAANKALNYLDGKQHEEVVKFLDSPSGRKDWRSRGYVPRFRNITSMIIEKSGRLFKDTAPKLEVFNFNQSSADEDQSAKINELLSRTEWTEFFNNVDAVTRLLKTTAILVQWDNQESKLVFDLLHRGNCSVIRQANGKIDGLIYRVSGGESTNYRVFTSEVIIDLMESEDRLSITGNETNTYGIVPVAAFYDTRAPRWGFWVDGGTDLINLNESLNIHLTDNEQVISWMKRPTLYTNARFETDGDQIEVVTDYGSALPRAQAATPGLIAGPDRVIQLDTQGVDSPFVEYKIPSVDLAPIDAVISQLIKSVASDWSVRIRGTGDGSATSGFQLIVEEVDNLELRSQRARQFENGFKRLFRVIRTVSNTVGIASFNPDADLFVQFPKANLPIDQSVEMATLTSKLSNGLISRTQYFIDQGMSRVEAENHVRQIDLDRRNGL